MIGSPLMIPGADIGTSEHGIRDVTGDWTHQLIKKCDDLPRKSQRRLCVGHQEANHQHFPMTRWFHGHAMRNPEKIKGTVYHEIMDTLW